jgi:molecular chaperone GrpE
MTREHEAFDHPSAGAGTGDEPQRPGGTAGDADRLTGGAAGSAEDADRLTDAAAEDPADADQPADAVAGDEAGTAGDIENNEGDDQETLDLAEIGSFLAGSDELKKIVVQRDEYLDSLRRLQADFDNYRKRAIRQQTELVERATEGLLVRLLPVLDALDLAMAHLPSAREGNDSEAMKSLVQIGTLLRDVLEREGLERIDHVGVPFDPTVHDAVAQAGPDEGQSQEDTGADGQAGGEEVDPGSTDKSSVASVMRSGYRLKGRVLRPAMVSVRS